MRVKEVRLHKDQVREGSWYQKRQDMFYWTCHLCKMTFRPEEPCYAHFGEWQDVPGSNGKRLLPGNDYCESCHNILIL